MRLGPDEEGCLVYVDGGLAALLVRLSEIHDSKSGKWFLEATFGLHMHHSTAPVFSTLEEAGNWLAERVHDAGALASGRA
jgi:hypothetical protein